MATDNIAQEAFLVFDAARKEDRAAARSEDGPPGDGDAVARGYATAVAGAAARPADFFWLGSILAGWGILFLLAAGPTVLGFELYTVSLVYLPSIVANLMVTLHPAITSVTAHLLPGERLRGTQVGGGLMILAGVLFLRVYDGWLPSRSVVLVPQSLEQGGG